MPEIDQVSIPNKIASPEYAWIVLYGTRKEGQASIGSM